MKTASLKHKEAQNACKDSNDVLGYFCATIHRYKRRIRTGCDNAHMHVAFRRLNCLPNEYARTTWYAYECSLGQLAGAASPHIGGISGIPCAILLGMLTNSTLALAESMGSRALRAKLQPGLVVCTKGVLQAGIICVGEQPNPCVVLSGNGTQIFREGASDSVLHRSGAG